MTTSAYFPYRSEQVKDSCFGYFDSLAARQWPISPSADRTVQTSYGPTFVRIGGPPDAPPLILLHGATASSLMWAPNVEALATEYRTFAVDQIGDFGKSTCAKPLPSFDDLVLWLGELLDGLELRSGVNLVGMSYGGALAARYALRHPQRLSRVVLLAPAATVLQHPAEFWIRLVWAAIANRTGMTSFIRWIFADMVRQDPQWVDETLDGVFLNIRSLQKRKTPIPPVWTDAEWTNLQPRTLFLVGSHDVVYSAVKAVARLKRVAPGVTAEILPGAGHDLTVAHAEMVNRRILEFLKSPA